MKEIQISKRPDHYHAMVVGEPECWGYGKTRREAFGDLCWTHCTYLGLRVLVTDRDSDAREGGR